MMYDFNNLESSYTGIENTYDAKGVAQCSYNNDTFITWAGFDDESTYFDNFQMIGGVCFCYFRYFVFKYVWNINVKTCVTYKC